MLLVIVSVVLVILLGLVLLTLFRYLFERHSSLLTRRPKDRVRSSRGVRELSPWEIAGRRAKADLTSQEHDSEDGHEEDDS